MFCGVCEAFLGRNGTCSVCGGTANLPKFKPSHLSGQSKNIVSVNRRPEAFLSKICERCNKKTITVALSQTRAADEAPTKFYKCNTCGFSFVEYS